MATAEQIMNKFIAQVFVFACMCDSRVFEKSFNIKKMNDRSFFVDILEP